MEINKRKSIMESRKVFVPWAKDDDFIEITEWANGEGIDVHFENGNSIRTISLFYEELDAINYLSMALSYNQETNKD